MFKFNYTYTQYTNEMFTFKKHLEQLREKKCWFRKYQSGTIERTRSPLSRKHVLTLPRFTQEWPSVKANSQERHSDSLELLTKSSGPFVSNLSFHLQGSWQCLGSWISFSLYGCRRVINRIPASQSQILNAVLVDIWSSGAPLKAWRPGRSVPFAPSLAGENSV